jgi:excisionase family DNA binding protein
MEPIMTTQTKAPPNERQPANGSPKPPDITQTAKVVSCGLPKLLRAQEVAEITGLSVAKIYSMAAAGDIPALHAGTSVRIPLAALEKWIEANTAGGEVQ